MADNTPIEWTDATWNPVTGCSVISPGCTNCYAMKDSGRRLKNHPSRKGLTEPSKAGPVWNGKVRFNEDWLTQPLRWRKPRLIFTCAHGDLFHDNVPDEWIDRVFAVMALCPQHIFQVLTKRPERMREYLQSRSRSDDHGQPADDIRAAMTALVNTPSRRNATPALKAIPIGQYAARIPWPLPNVWLGVSVEDQQRADERIPHLLDTPAALRWVSYEPALGPVDFTRICLLPQKPGSARAGIHVDPLRGRYCESGVDYKGEWDVDDPAGPPDIPARRLDWIIVGGESGPGARPFDTGWARTIIRQCREASVPVFVKQVGSKPIERRYRAPSWPPFPLGDKKGGDPAEWPADLRVREFPQLKEQSDDQAPR